MCGLETTSLMGDLSVFFFLLLLSLPQLCVQYYSRVILLFYPSALKYPITDYFVFLNLYVPHGSLPFVETLLLWYKVACASEW